MYRRHKAGNSWLNTYINNNELNRCNGCNSIKAYNRYVQYQEQGIQEHKNEKKATAQVLTKLEYAGAQIPLYYIVNNELTVIKGNRLNIGGCEMISKKEKPLLREYTNHDIPIKKNMSIYLFSDGYMDQYKEKEKTKFGIQNFKNLLLKNQNLDMQIQKKFIENAHEQWKGKSNQIDDILVLGVKL